MGNSAVTGRLRYHRLAAADLVADLNGYLNSGWHKDIGPRAELDHAEPFADLSLAVKIGVGGGARPARTRGVNFTSGIREYRAARDMHAQR